MPKILPNGTVSYEPGREPDGPREHPGTGEPMVAAGHPADGTFAEVHGEPLPEGAPEPEQVVQLPPGEYAVLEPVSPPPVSAPKADHVAYVSEVLDVPPDEAQALTKPELVELARSADVPEPPSPPRVPPRRTPPATAG